MHAIFVRPRISFRNRRSMALFNTSTTMDSIKLKMQCLIMERDNAIQYSTTSTEKQKALQEALDNSSDKLERINNQLSIALKSRDNANDKIESLNGLLAERDKTIDYLQRELQSADRKRTLLEHQITDVESMLAKYKNQIEELTGTNDINRISLQVAETSANTASDKLTNLEEQFANEAAKYSDMSDKYQDVCRKLTISNVELEKVQRMLNSMEGVLRRSECDLKQTLDDNQSLKIAQSKLSEREMRLEADIVNLKAKLERSEILKEKAERETFKHKIHCEELESLLEQERKRVKSMKEELELALVGIV